MGAPSSEQLDTLQEYVSQVIQPFALRLNEEIAWRIRPDNFIPPQTTPAVVAFFGGVGVSEGGLTPLFASDGNHSDS